MHRSRTLLGMLATATTIAALALALAPPAGAGETKPQDFATVGAVPAPGPEHHAPGTLPLAPPGTATLVQAAPPAATAAPARVQQPAAPATPVPAAPAPWSPPAGALVFTPGEKGNEWNTIGPASSANAPALAPEFAPERATARWDAAQVSAALRAIPRPDWSASFPPPLRAFGTTVPPAAGTAIAVPAPPSAATPLTGTRRPFAPKAREVVTSEARDPALPPQGSERKEGAR